MSIEIAPFEGSAEELSQFIVENWKRSYEGKMAVPTWTPQYFDWQMTGSQHADRNSLISARLDGNLVGTLLYMEFPLWVLGQEYQGCLGSWLTVAPECRRMGVASLMSAAMKARQRDKDYFARLGYAFHGARASLGPRFWKRSVSQAQTLKLKEMKLWARVLDPRRVANWSNKSWERLLLKSLPVSVCRVAAASAQTEIRAYTPEDMQACRELINNQARRSDLAMLWTEDRLRSHLAYEDLAHTLVVERQGRVVGFLNYHLLGLNLYGQIQSAIVDMLACQELTGREIRDLVNAALAKMRDEQGVALVLMREFAHQPHSALLSCRFLPQFSDSALILTGTTEESAKLLRRCRNVHVVWR